jgi:hypothetical protein
VKDINVVGDRMTRNGLNLTNSKSCLFNFRTDIISNNDLERKHPDFRVGRGVQNSLKGRSKMAERHQTSFMQVPRWLLSSPYEPICNVLEFLLLAGAQNTAV